MSGQRGCSDLIASPVSPELRGLPRLIVVAARMTVVFGGDACTKNPEDLLRLKNESSEDPKMNLVVLSAAMGQSIGVRSVIRNLQVDSYETRTTRADIALQNGFDKDARRYQFLKRAIWFGNDST